jgi:hypothetical protein
MKQFGFTLTTLFCIGLLGYGGFVAIKKLEDPKKYIIENNERLGDIHKVATGAEENKRSPVGERLVVETKPVTTQVSTIDSTNGPDLQMRIQKIIDQKLILKKGVKGEPVAAVQEFMNQYFKTSAKVDSDFGKNLEANVKKFQTANKISSTGQIATKTLQAMIDWLIKNT